MRTIPDFEDELKTLDGRLSVRPNLNYPQLASIMLDGTDVCAIPAGDIKDEPDSSYTVTIRDMQMRHKSKAEALDIVKKILDAIKTKDGADLFFGRD